MSESAPSSSDPSSSGSSDRVSPLMDFVVIGDDNGTDVELAELHRTASVLGQLATPEDRSDTDVCHAEAAAVDTKCPPLKEMDPSSTIANHASAPAEHVPEKASDEVDSHPEDPSSSPAPDEPKQADANNVVDLATGEHIIRGYSPAVSEAYVSNSDLTSNSSTSSPSIGSENLTSTDRSDSVEPSEFHGKQEEDQVASNNLSDAVDDHSRTPDERQDQVMDIDQIIPVVDSQDELSARSAPPTLDSGLEASFSSSSSDVLPASNSSEERKEGVVSAQNAKLTEQAERALEAEREIRERLTQARQLEEKAKAGYADSLIKKIEATKYYVTTKERLEAEEQTSKRIVVLLEKKTATLRAEVQQLQQAKEQSVATLRKLGDDIRIADLKLSIAVKKIQAAEARLEEVQRAEKQKLEDAKKAELLELQQQRALKIKEKAKRQIDAANKRQEEMKSKEVQLLEEKFALGQKQRSKDIRANKAQVAAGEAQLNKLKQMTDEELLREAKLGDKSYTLAIFDAAHPIDWNEDLYADDPLYGWRAEETVALTTFHFNPKKKAWVIRKNDRVVRIKRNPFGKGAMRLAYFMEDMETGQHMVAKESCRLNPDENCEQFFLNDIYTQLIAKQFADEFMSPAHRLPKNLDVVRPCLIKCENGQFFAAEMFLEGDFNKYNNNARFKHPDGYNTAQAFSHFTYDKSNGTQMVVDLQGVEYMLTDPQIHSCVTAEDKDGTSSSSSSSVKSARSTFGAGDTGAQGIADFFLEHSCNDVCKRLGLKTNKYMKSEEEKSAFASAAAAANRAPRMVTVAAAGYVSSSGLCVCGDRIPAMTKDQYLKRLQNQEIWCENCTEYRSAIAEESGTCAYCPASVEYHPFELKLRNLTVNDLCCKSEECLRKWDADEIVESFAC